MGELGTERDFGDLFRVCSIKGEAGESLSTCMRLNRGSVSGAVATSKRRDSNLESS